MKKILIIAVFVVAIGGFAQEAKQKTISVETENRKIATTLPTRVLDPRTYQNTSTLIRHVDTQSLVRQGYNILDYNNGKPNNLGYMPHYDPNLHHNVYMRVPNSGKNIYGKRW